MKRSNIESTKDKREAPPATASAAAEYGTPAITKRISQHLYGGISTPPYSTYGPPQTIGASQYGSLGRFNDLNAVHGLASSNGYNTFGNNLEVVPDHAGYDSNYHSNQQVFAASPYGAIGNADFGNEFHGNRFGGSFGGSFGSVLGGIGSTSSLNGHPPPPSNTYLPAAAPNQHLPVYASGTKGLGHYAGASAGLGQHSSSHSNGYHQSASFDQQRYNAPFTNSRPIALTSAALAAQTYSSNSKDAFRPSAFLGSTLLPSTPDYQYAQPSLSLTSLGVANQYHSPLKTYLPSNVYQSHAPVAPTSYAQPSSPFGASYTEQNVNFASTGSSYSPKTNAGYGVAYSSYRPNPTASFSHNHITPTYATPYDN